MNPSFTLALDTSHKTGSLCLAKKDQLLETRKWENEKSHAEQVTAIIEDVLKKNSIALKDIDLFCVNVGPGSFTGIRIAINAVKSFAYAYSKPIFTANSLEIIAAACSADAQNLMVAINAHSDMCYTAQFMNKNNQWELQGPIVAKNFSEMLSQISNPQTIFAGDAFDIYKDKLPANTKLARPKTFTATPEAETLLKLALHNLSNQDAIKDWKTLEPFYIRLSAPEEKARN
jgi:N6-L-threonylcarbamoyladenine synthase/tRNA threonylcarbamoyladenosine biosynthesis protein TsaB